MDYSHEHFEERDLSGIKGCFPRQDKGSFTWINLDSTKIEVAQWKGFIWVVMFLVAFLMLLYFWSK